MSFQGKVAGVQEAANRTRIVALERLGAWRHKERIVLAPYRQKRRLVSPEVFLERRIQCDVALVIAEEIELHFIRTGTGQIEVVEVLTIRRHDRLVRYAVRVLPAGCLRSEEGAERLSVRLRRVLPIRPDRSPALAETFLVGIAVLRDDGGDPLGAADSEPEARRRTIVKDIDREAAEADDFGKAFDHTGNVVQRVTEFLPRRHVGLTETRKVGCDDMKSVGAARDQVTDHVARAREAVQKQQLRRVGCPRLAIENLETVDIGCAVLDG